MHIQRQPFLIIEILVSVALLLLCLFPLTSLPYRAFIKESRILQEIELERMSDLYFTKCLETLQNEYILDALSLDKTNPTIIELEPLHLEIEKVGTFNFQSNAQLYISSLKNTRALVHCQLQMIPDNPKSVSKKFDYTFTVEKNTM